MTHQPFYTYDDIPDKTVAGIKAEVESGLVEIAHYFATTLGFPLDLFNEELERNFPTNLGKLHFYMAMRNQNPGIFKV
jgi:hypothetical protein